MRDLLQKIQQQHCQSLPATQRPFCLWLEEDSCAGGLISFVIEVSAPGVATLKKRSHARDVASCRTTQLQKIHVNPHQLEKYSSAQPTPDLATSY